MCIAWSRAYALPVITAFGKKNKKKITPITTAFCFQRITVVCQLIGDPSVRRLEAECLGTCLMLSHGGGSSFARSSTLESTAVYSDDECSSPSHIRSIPLHCHTSLCHFPILHYRWCACMRPTCFVQDKKGGHWDRRGQVKTQLRAHTDCAMTQFQEAKARMLPSL